ncbi:MAG: universal stress protein, partial [Hyphomicrobiaceae bacterium]
LHKRILDENLAIQGTIAEQIIQATHLPVLVVKNKPNGAYGSVIVGVDFSAYSRAAVRSAARIAPSSDMHLVHAYGPDAASRSGTQGTSPGARSATAQQARLASFVEEEMLALKTSTGVGRSTLNRVHQVSQPGEPHTVLKDQARQLHAELIVMGTHGRIGVARSILGSVTTELLNDRLADVLVIKPF